MRKIPTITEKPEGWDEEDEGPVNGKLRRIEPQGIMAGLAQMAGSGILKEDCVQLLMDACTLIAMKYDE